MNYLLDSNILLVYLRDIGLKTYIEDNYAPFDPPNIPIISIVTVGELKALALKNNWGPTKLHALELLLQQHIIADINAEDVIERYAEIDAFSQGRLKNRPLNMSARNMGKNDIWIAATAAVIGAKLITIDNDFDHLNGAFLEVIKIDNK